MLLQKQRNLCLRVQYILYLQYNKQWYQIARQIYLPNFLPFRTVAFRITNCSFNSYFSNFVSFSVFELNCRIKTFLDSLDIIPQVQHK